MVFPKAPRGHHLAGPDRLSAPLARRVGGEGGSDTRRDGHRA